METSPQLTIGRMLCSAAKCRVILAWGILAWSLLPTPAYAASRRDGPESRQSAKAPAQSLNPGPLVQRLQRWRQSLLQLDLTDDQKAKLSDLFQQIRPRILALRQARQNGQQVAAQAQAIFADLRQGVLAILTPEQAQRLRELLIASAANGVDPARVAGTAPRASATASGAAATRPRSIFAPSSSDADRRSTQLADHPTTAPAPQSATPTPQTGSPAPPFKLLTPGSATIQLSTLKGRVVVLLFGSMTAPTFRGHTPEMERISQQYSTKAYLLIIYTREAHPAGGWEIARNLDDGISIPDPADLPARQAQAARTQSQLHITIPMVVDTMDNATADAYGAFPNGAIVINRDGTIAARQQWNDPSGLPRLIDAAWAEN